MQVREFNVETDYSDVASWWKKQDWMILPKEVLGIKGFIVEDNGEKLAASWVYRDKSCPICIMEWTVGNPDADWEKRKEAIDLVINSCTTWAKEDGATLMLTMTKSKRFLEKLQDKDFVQTDDGMTHLIRSL